jgi:dihydroorotase
MNATIIKNALIVNEGNIISGDLLLKGTFIEKIGHEIQYPGAKEINGAGKYLLPGVIDDQVHFREPGLTHKADIYSESRAALAGGVTSFMEMPNTNPQAITIDLLEEKYNIASRTSAANYSFFMGGTNNNIDELKKVDASRVCGIKLFMGSSTGNMLVDNMEVLDRIFSECPNLIAIHSESEPIILSNLEKAIAEYGEDIPFSAHPLIRSVEACYQSTVKAIALAEKHNTRLHVLHISTEEETRLFKNNLPLREKRITAEACVHHLWYDAGDYATLGGLIKCNPAIKESRHKKAIFNALLDGRIDIIATDHAPHTWAEKQEKYLNCPSGLPLVQHPLLIMLEFYYNGKISLEKIAEKMSHAPAECFNLLERGYIREGYKADLVLVDFNIPHKVTRENILYKCGWSPLEDTTFKSSIDSTFVNGHLVFNGGRLLDPRPGERLKFKPSF